MGSSIKHVRKIFRKTNISKPPIRTCMCAYQGVRHVVKADVTSISNFLIDQFPARENQADLKKKTAFTFTQLFRLILRTLIQVHRKTIANKHMKKY